MKALSFVRTFVRNFSSSSQCRAVAKVAVKDIRNIGIIAHIDAGKTTTTERMLFYSGITSRIGDVDQGDTVTDYLPAERARGITIQSAAITMTWNKHRVNLIDTPGHADFGFEVTRSLKVLDGAVTILDAVAGVEAQTETVYKQSEKIPKIFFINKMDRMGAGFGRTVKEIITKLKTRVLLLNVPYFVEEGNDQNFIGVLDVVEKKLIKWDESNKIIVEELQGEVYEEVSRCRESLIETLGEIDENVINSFLETEDYMEVPSKIIKAAIRKATLERFAIPVLCGASFKNIGVQPLMDAITNFLPSPIECVPEISGSVKLEEGKFIVNNNKALTVALAFKVINHPIRGSLVFVRVYSGILKSNSTIYVKKRKFKIGKLLIMHADVPEEVDEISAGNIGVIVSEELKTGDTILSSVNKKNLVDKDLKIVANPIDIPPPVFSISLEPRTAGDQRSMDAGLQILLREDPSLKVSIDEETGQTLLSGMGELHLEIAADRLRDLKVKFEVGRVMVSYRETLIKTLKSQNITEEGYSISLEVEPYHEGYQFSEAADVVKLGDGNYLIAPDSKLFEDSLVPEVNIINALVAGSIPPLQHGANKRLPVHGVVIRVQDIGFPVDADVVTAWNPLMRTTLQGLFQNPKDFELLEPMMNVKLEVNGSDIGNVIQDLTSARNAVIESIDEDMGGVDLAHFREVSESQYVPKDYTMNNSTHSRGATSNGQTINAVVPLKEMVGYLPRLRSLTQGRSIFNMEYRGMQVVTNERIATIEEDL